jgi:hypothetical protein
MRSIIISALSVIFLSVTCFLSNPAKADSDCDPSCPFCFCGDRDHGGDRGGNRPANQPPSQGGDRENRGGTTNRSNTNNPLNSNERSRPLPNAGRQ